MMTGRGRSEADTASGSVLIGPANVNGCLRTWDVNTGGLNRGRRHDKRRFTSRLQKGNTIIVFATSRELEKGEKYL